MYNQYNQYGQYDPNNQYDQKERTMFDVFVELLKGALGILFLISYGIVFLFNAVTFVLTLIGNGNVFEKLYTALECVPVLVITIGVIFLFLAGRKSDINKLRNGLRFLKASCVITIIFTVIDTFLSLFVFSELSHVSYGVAPTLSLAVYLTAVISLAINIAFQVLLYKLADNLLYSAECDIPLPGCGKAASICMIVCGALLAIAGFASLLTEPLAAVAVIFGAVFYGLLSAMVFIYRSEAKKIYYRREFLKHQQDGGYWNQRHYY